MILYTLLTLALASLNLEQGKVIVRTGVAGAELYLDGNFVARTDARGTLTMESFPSGTFRFAVKKEGYREFAGAFSVEEGQTKLVTLALEPIKVHKSPPPSHPRSETARAIHPAVRTHAPKSVPPADSHTQRQPVAETRAAIHPSKPTPIDPTAPREEGSSAALWIVLATIAIVGVAAFLVWNDRRKVPGPSFGVQGSGVGEEIRGSMFEIQETGVQASKFDVQGQEVQSSEEVQSAMFNVQGSEGEVEGSQTVKEKPEFLEELRRKEELIKAGFVPKGSREFSRDAAANKEREVVIVLPKEAYRYEEEK